MSMITRAAAVGGRSSLRNASALLQKQGPGGSSQTMVLRTHNEYHRRNGPSTCQFLHTHVLGGSPLEEDRRRRKEQQKYQQLACREYHGTAKQEKGVAIVLGLGAVSALAYAGSSAVRAYNEYKASLPSEEELEEMRKQQEKESEAERQQREAQAAAKKEKEKKEGKRENIFAKWFGVGVGAKYYEGGFEEVMTRREAALILGVRESSPAARIKDAHRKLLVLNHPDTGGSTYVAGKINEAKELLLKGKRGK